MITNPNVSHRRGGVTLPAIRRNAWKIAPALLLLAVWLAANAEPGWTAQANSAASDKAALMAFYKATNGDGWNTNANWNSNKPLSQWHGVTTNSNGRVTKLELDQNDVKGILPPEIGNLTELTDLGLFGNTAPNTPGNQVSGPIPPEIGKLTKLEELDLGYNSITGSVPPELGNIPNLKTIYFDSTYLSGALPVEVAKIKPWLYDGDGDGQPDDTTTNVAWAISTWSAPSFTNTRGLCLGLQPEIDEWLNGDGYTGDGDGNTDTDDPFTNAVMEDARCLILMETSPSRIVEPLSGSKDVEVTVTAKVNHIIGAEVSLPLNALGGNAAKGSSADYEIVGTAPTAITIPADAMKGSATYTIRVHSDSNHAEGERIEFTGADAKYTAILDSNNNPTAVPTNYFYGYTRTKASLDIIDPYTITLSASPDAIEEADSGDKTVNVAVKAAIDPAPGSAVTITTAFAGDATSADYSAAAPAITIPANATEGSATFALTVKSNDDSGETHANGKSAEEMDKLEIAGSASVGGSAVTVNKAAVFLREPDTDLGEALFGVTSDGVAHWDYAIPGAKAQDYDNSPLADSGGMKYKYFEIRWMETAQKAVGAGWDGKSNKVFYDNPPATYELPGLKVGAEYKAKLFVELSVGDQRYYAKSAATTFTASDLDVAQVEKPLFSASPTGTVNWRYDPPESRQTRFDYYEVRWMKTSDKAVGAGWDGKSNRVFYTDRVSNFDIPNLKAATEYKAKLFVGITADNRQRYVKSDTITFTTPRENPVIAFAVSQGLAKWSDNRPNRATYGYYEVQWKDASESGWGKRSSVIFFNRSGAFQIPGLRAGKWYTARLYVGQHPSETGAKNNHYSKEATFRR